MPPGRWGYWLTALADPVVLTVTMLGGEVIGWTILAARVAVIVAIDVEGDLQGAGSCGSSSNGSRHAHSQEP
ncbi:MAG: hypothetical protein U5R31_07655 [Acidimicrobiia bacterium]|nr:hypothetical protein [Acidimicrobiia bacterium]